MRPPRKPQLSDTAIRAVLLQLQQGGGPVSCAQLRRELRVRTGRAGGVRRVYRLWKASMPAPPVADASIETLQMRIAQLESEVVSVRGRAELAEHREQCHQDAWALEIDQIRQRLKVYEHVGYRPERQAEFVLNLQRQLHTARERIFELETRLASGPGAHSAEGQCAEEGAGGGRSQPSHTEP